LIALRDDRCDKKIDELRVRVMLAEAMALFG
jgi:hypothetical protein